jgi:hypothetical protein
VCGWRRSGRAAGPRSRSPAAKERRHPTRPVTLHFDVDVINFIEAPLSENDGREGGLPLQSALIALKTEATNERSRAALAALPARFDGVFRKHMLVRDGESRDSAWYAVVDDDWHDVKQHVSTRVAQRASARSPAEDRRVEA